MSEIIIFLILIFVCFIAWQLSETHEVLKLIHKRLTWIHEDLKKEFK